MTTSNTPQILLLSPQNIFWRLVIVVRRPHAYEIRDGHAGKGPLVRVSRTLVGEVGGYGRDASVSQEAECPSPDSLGCVAGEMDRHRSWRTRA